MKRRKTVKNVHYNFSKPEVMSLNDLFCPTHSSKPEDIPFKIKHKATNHHI